MSFFSIRSQNDRILISHFFSLSSVLYVKGEQQLNSIDLTRQIIIFQSSLVTRSKKTNATMLSARLQQACTSQYVAAHIQVKNSLGLYVLQTFLCASGFVRCSFIYRRPVLQQGLLQDLTDVTGPSADRGRFRRDFALQTVTEHSHQGDRAVVLE